MTKSNKPNNWQNIKISILGKEVEGLTSVNYDGKETINITFRPKKHAEKIAINFDINLFSLRLSMIGMYKDGIDMHPQEYMRHLGYNFIDSEPLEIGDCWMFQVTEIIEPLNKHLTLCDWKFD